MCVTYAHEPNPKKWRQWVNNNQEASEEFVVRTANCQETHEISKRPTMRMMTGFGDFEGGANAKEHLRDFLWTTNFLQLEEKPKKEGEEKKLRKKIRVLKTALVYSRTTEKDWWCNASNTTTRRVVSKCTQILSVSSYTR